MKYFPKIIIALHSFTCGRSVKFPNMTSVSSISISPSIMIIIRIPLIDRYLGGIMRKASLFRGNIKSLKQIKT